MSSVFGVSTSVPSVDEKLLWGASSMARSIILGGRARGDLAKKRAVDAECIKAATTANAREAPEVSSGNRRGPPNQLISSPKKLEPRPKLYVLSSPAVCLSSSVLGVENEGDDPLDWLRSSIPGEPGTDYPIMAATQVSTHLTPFSD